MTSQPLLAGNLAPPSGRRIPGEEGIWVLLLGDMAVFAVFFITFMAQRSKAPEAFDVARRTLHTGIGLTNTFILLTSSLFVVIALGAVRARIRPVAGAAVIAAAACGLAFVGLKAYEYAALLAAGYRAGAGDFYLYYYILTGIHLFHVCLGLAVLAALWTQTRRKELSPTRIAVFESGTCFWHLVDLLWIVLFPLLYLVS
jgi:nitric oxide reductase NorE protein